ncbi:MAG: integrase [Gammaproteobacteria bacterium]|nr:integrase [Gammaproteobacteria bacterium]
MCTDICLTQVDFWREVACRLAEAGHGERASIVAEAADQVGLSVQTAYRRLKELAGWTSGRKRRGDAGSTSQSTEVLELAAAMRREATRANGKRIMPIGVALNVAHANGLDVTVSRSQFGRLMRARRLDYRGLEAAEAHGVEMRSEHPNHVHEVDPSLCVIYYMHGKQQMMRAAEFYRNKLEKYAKVQHKVWRYVRTDHASAVIDVRYYVAAGELAINMADFLIYTWGRQPGRTNHGVPRILLWDKGSANTAAPVQALLEALEVEGIEHRAEAAWVKGQVEGAQQIVETHFESRLRLEPVESVDQLNAAAAHWCEAYNSNALEHIDARVRRPGIAPTARHDLWALIRADQVRELPAPEVCRALLEGKRVERTVDRSRQISYRHPQADRPMVYELRTCEGLVPSDKVTVSPLLTGDCAIRLYWMSPMGEERVWRVEPRTEYDQFGRPLSAPIIGQEHRALPTSEAERIVADLDRLAYPDHDDAEEARRKQVTPFGGQLIAHSHLKDVETRTYLPRRGTEIDATPPEEREVPVSVDEALMRYHEALGRPLTREENRWFRGRYPEGISDADLVALCAQATAPAAPAAEPVTDRPQLRMVT